ncbi:MAG: sterol desaturase family protein [Ilumatobacteraceae bacterium]|jgi:sterol desaturase/sphingolipid hydroxylase (fatty acid hydroxylase superfamily)
MQPLPARVDRALAVLYAPLVVMLAAASVVWAATQRPWLIAAIVIAVVALTFFAERRIPVIPAWNKGDGVGVDSIHAVVNESITALGVLTVPTLSAALPGSDVWPDEAPLLVRVVVAVLVLDAGVTLTHWWSHRSPPLWRFHAVHHGPGRLYGLNGLMKHPIHLVVETVAGMTPLIVLGVDDTTAAAVAGLVAVQLVLQHANVDYRVGAVGRWMAWNAGHRLHHVADPADGNVNFGLFTLVWDRLLGTFRPPTGTEVALHVGLADATSLPSGYLAQLTMPWRSRSSQTGRSNQPKNRVL